eukprot:1264376-Rhodomonas_salina.4
MQRKRMGRHMIDKASVRKTENTIGASFVSTPPSASRTEGRSERERRQSQERAGTFAHEALDRGIGMPDRERARRPADPEHGRAGEQPKHAACHGQRLAGTRLQVDVRAVPGLRHNVLVARGLGPCAEPSSHDQHESLSSAWPEQAHQLGLIHPVCDLRRCEP